MANPRKFAEKIALMNQKEAEQNAAYQQIMADVTPITRAPSSNEEAETPQQPVYRERGRSPGIGPMKRDRRIDTSPYNSSSSYLVPPDSSWKHRSDSALHQSSLNAHNHSPGSPRRSLSPMGGVMNDRGCLAVNNDMRANRSSSDVRVPRISIDPTQTDPNAVSIPIPNTTGSLPDLHNIHFQLPTGMTPIDPEDPNSSPCSTAIVLKEDQLKSPQGATSPSTLSPTSMPTRQSGRFSFGSQGSAGSPQATSPGHSPVSRRRVQQQQQQQQLIMGAAFHHLNHQLDVPSYNANYNHMSGGFPTEHNGMIDSGNMHQQLYQQQTQQRQMSPQPPHSPQQAQQPNQEPSSPLVNSNHNMPSPQSLSVYRNPIPILRPSPQPSPVPGGYLMPGSPDYRSASPADTASHSAPQSPVSQNLSPASSPGIGGVIGSFPEHNNFNYANTQLQHEFSQITMQETGIYANSPPNSAFVTGQYQELVQGSSDNGRTGSQDIGSGDMGYFSRTSPNYSNMNSNSGGSTQQTTPQTPTPNITISDFSDEGSTEHELSKDLGAAMITASFDTEILTEEILSAMDPILPDDMPMLNNNAAITDTYTEEHLRFG